MLVGGEGVAVGVVVDGVVARTLPDTVDVGCVLAVLLGGAVEGGTVAGGSAAAGAVLGSAQLGGLAGTVASVPGRLAAGGLVVGSGEDCAAGEAEAPDVTDGWLAGWAAGLPGCPVKALTAA
jgi:hypothetical protein